MDANILDVDVKMLTDNALLEHYQSLYPVEMYYRTSERNWGAEKKDREEVSDAFYRCVREMKERNLW